MLSTPHGDVALAVTRDLAERLAVGDVVLVRFTEDSDLPANDDFPSASPREEEPAWSREKI
jgi:hypothetical protein